MKYLGRLIIIFSLLFWGICISNNFVGNYSQSCLEAKTVYLRTALTGGGEALDGIDGSLLGDADVAFVMYSSITYFYLLDADLGGAESPPDIIAPDTNPGNKRWVLQGSTPIGGGGGAPSNAHYYTNQAEAGLSAEVVPAANVISILSAADYAAIKVLLSLGNVTNESKATMFTSPTFTGTVTIPTPFTLGAVSVTPTGTELNYVAGVTSAIQTQLDAKIPKSTIVAAGDVLVGTGAATPGVITKGPNNSLFGVDNSGTLGFFGSLSQVLVAAPTVDDTYSATAIATFVAGEALAQWDVVYCKNKAGVSACYKYDANGADKAEPPRGVATAAISADAAGVFCIGDCIVRNDGWTAGQAGATNTDEGKRVYASNTPGEITITEPATDGVVVGTLVEEKVVWFKFKNDGASTGYGAPVKANTPTLITPIIGAATGTSLMATGRVDGTVGMLISTAASPTTIVVATHGNASYFMNIGDSAANSIFTLPTAVAGLQYCIKNYTGITTVLKFQTSAAGQYIDLDGVNTATGGLIKSAGAAGDGACVVGVDATHWVAYPNKGVWSKD